MYCVLTGEDPFWSISAEVEDHVFSCSVDAITGQDSEATLFNQPFSTDTFDNWNEEEAEARRIAFEKEAQEGYQGEEIPEDIAKELMAQKLAALEEFAADMAGSPYEGKAIEIVNDGDIGGKARATSARVFAEGGSSDEAGYTLDSWYVLDVALDDGTYLEVTLNRGDSSLFSYRRKDGPIEDDYQTDDIYLAG